MTDETPTPVTITMEGAGGAGFMTISARSQKTNAVLASKVVDQTDMDRVSTELAKLGTRTVEPVAALEAILGPMERYPDLTGCVHSENPHGFCPPCGRRAMGLEPGEPEYRWNP